MNLAKYSLDNTKIVYFFLAVLLIGGVFSFGRLGKKEDAPFVIKTRSEEHTSELQSHIGISYAVFCLKK